MLDQSIPGGLHPVERTYAGALLEELQPMERTHAGAVHEALYPVGGTQCWSSAQLQESSLRRKEQQRQSVMN